MSREHKYRAWDENSEIMYYSDAGWNEAHPESDDCFFDFHEGHVVAFLRQTEPGTIDEPPYDYGEPVECEEVTGLKDKGGVEIYEGDIAKQRRAGWPSGHLTGGEVKIEVSRGVTIGNWPAAFDIEVVGNIHEHPNLIPGSDNRKGLSND